MNMTSPWTWPCTPPCPRSPPCRRTPRGWSPRTCRRRSDRQTSWSSCHTRLSQSWLGRRWGKTRPERAGFLVSASWSIVFRRKTVDSPCIQTTGGNDNFRSILANQNSYSASNIVELVQCFDEVSVSLVMAQNICVLRLAYMLMIND